MANGSKRVRFADARGRLAYSQGHLERATALCQDALQIARMLGDNSAIAFALGGLGRVAQSRGEYPQAARLAEEYLALVRAERNSYLMADALSLLSETLLGLGEFSRAAVHLHQALALRREIGDMTGCNDLLAVAAGIALACGQPRSAASLLGAYDTVRSTMVFAQRPIHRDEQKRVVAGTRLALGDSGFCASWTAGQEMSLDAAVECASNVLRDASRSSDDRVRGLAASRANSAVARDLTSAAGSGRTSYRQSVRQRRRERSR